MNNQIIKSVLGMRGGNPNAIDTTELLIDRLDERGVHIKTWQSDGIEKNAWNEAGLGSLPSEAELILAANPNLILSQQANAGETGVIVTCALQGGGNTTIYWRCIDPDGVEHLDNEVSNVSQDTWEILMGKSGLYTVAAWAVGYGYAEISFEGV